MRRLVSFGIAALALAACSGGSVKETLGLEREAPDEFRVVSHPPLSVPPVFNLRPPAGASELPAGSNAEADARKLVTGVSAASQSLDADPSMQVDTAVAPVTTSALSSSGESQLLSRAGADKKQENIREVIHQEAPDPEVEKEKTIIDKLNPANSTEQPTVDAKGEIDRLKKNKAENKPVTAGETPVEDPKKKSVLERIF